MTSPNWPFISEYLTRAGLRREVFDWVQEAYEHDYDKVSNGCTGVPEIDFDGLKLKSPLCVAHDYLYDTKQISRYMADKMLKWGLDDLGHPIRAVVWFRVLRLIGWAWWRRA